MKFFRPDKYKIGTTFLLILLLMVGLYLNQERDANLSDDYTRDAGVMIILSLPLTIIHGLNNLISCGDLITCGIESGSTPGLVSFFGLILELSYLYLIACTIVFLIRKYRK